MITNEKLLMGFNTDPALEQRAEELQRNSKSDNEFMLYGGGKPFSKRVINFPLEGNPLNKWQGYY